MAIGNVTPDSFYASSRLWASSSAQEQKECILQWAKEAIADGADILDIGGCSTRPGSTPASEEEEWLRVEPALRALREVLPEMPLSLDTFRPAVAEKALRQIEEKGYTGAYDAEDRKVTLAAVVIDGTRRQAAL